MAETTNGFATTYAKAKEKMIATNEATYSGYNSRRYVSKLRDYTPEEIDRIVKSGSLTEQQKLSYNYYYKDRYYAQIINYYATLLKYVGILIPNPSFGQNLSNPRIQKRYGQAIDYIDRIQLPSMLTNFALRALMYGCYYGVIVKSDKNTFSVLDLPSSYCCSRFKDIYGNDIIEFDVSYFNTIADETERNEALNAYPAEVVSAYKRYVNGKAGRWYRISAAVGICFPFLTGRPPFIGIIPSTIQYDEAVETKRERDLEEIRKIIVQKIPHLTDGRLLFEPDEAEEIHAGTVGMMKNNPNVSVLTTYADVDAIVSKTTSDDNNSTLTQMMNNVYSQGGLSAELFAATGSSTLPASIRKDISLMMTLANKFSHFITNLINSNYQNGNITFKYIILPISEQNVKDYVSDTFKLANAGYSFLLPAIALGLTQKDLGNIKDLENDVLNLGDKLRPLNSAYTQSADAGEAGRPELSPEDKSEKTQQNEESLDNNIGQGGSE